MSHLTIAKVRIKNPNLDLLRQVFNVLAQEYKCEIINYVRDYYGRSQDVLFALALPGKGKAFGIGVQVDEQGNLIVIGDDWAFGKLFHEIRDKIVQYYTAMAIAQIAQQMGFQIVELNQTQDSIIISVASR